MRALSSAGVPPPRGNRRGPEVKICGVCRPEDAALVEGATADYIGVVLAPGLGRSRSLNEAEAIYGSAGAPSRVGVFVDPLIAEAWALAEQLELDIIQLHGSESPAQVAELRRGPWQLWKAVRPRGPGEFVEAIESYAPVVDALLVDGWSALAPGGTGSSFDWDAIAGVRGELPATLRLVVAGGLTHQNVGEVIERLAPDVVDTSSGVESSIGEKDPGLVRAFIAAARRGK